MTEKVTDEIREKAKVIAEATGRSEQAIIDDLMDDGIVNLSNEEKKDASLVEQLKEAAELIATVQSINQQVSDNTVLNGGNNKTEVAVETTLEGDIIDRAIDSVQRKADNIKKLAVTLVPVFLLLTGGSMEAVGITNFFGSDDSDDDYDPIYVEYGGCLNPDALNYDPEADYEDGSCEFDDSGGGGGPPDCEPDWWWQNEAIFDHDHDGQGFNNDLRVQVDFRDLNSCNIHMNNGYFEIMVGDEDRILEYNFHDEFTINEHYLNLPAGDYYVTVDYYTYDGNSWSGPTAWVTMESEPEIRGCTDSSATNYDDKATEDDGSCEYPPEECQVVIEDIITTVNDNTLEVAVDINVNENTDCPNNLDLAIVITNDGNDYEYTTVISATDGVRKHTFQFVYNGFWIPSVSIEEGNQQLAFDDSEAVQVDYQPECDDPYLYSIQGFTTSDTFRVAYDPDCPGNSERDIIVTLSARPHGTDTTLKSVTDSKTIVDAQYDDWSITLSDFVESPYTHYDFTWVMAWQDSNGDYQVDFTNWSNIEYDLPEESTPCENLTITSESLTLYAYGDDLGIAWNLTHDGPRTNDCFVEVELFFTLYQNGIYYNVSDYNQNPTFTVFNNHNGSQTLIFGPDEVNLFKDLPDGEYEILAKYRIKGTNESSDDHFANKVTISTS
jgi:predicted transcriptional regulator